MSENAFKLEKDKEGLSSLSPGEFLDAVDKAGGFLPVPTEVAHLSPESRAVIHTEPRSIGADRFRLLLIRLRAIQASKGIKSIVVTSPIPGDGKSTVALNLATGLSEDGKRPVLLLEADVHRPVAIKNLGLDPWPGLTERFKNNSDPMLAIRRIDPLGFYLLPAGHPDEDCSDLLQTDFASQLVRRVSSNFDWIVIDSPPTTPIADVLALKAQADATLLVVRAGNTPREAIEEAIQNLGREHILGIVINGIPNLDRTYSSYYGYGSSYARRGPKKNPVQRLGL